MYSTYIYGFLSRNHYIHDNVINKLQGAEIVRYALYLFFMYLIEKIYTIKPFP